MKVAMLGLLLTLSAGLAQGGGTSTAGTSVAQAGDRILKPGQVWIVTAKTASGQLQAFTVTLGAAPSTERDGMVVYANFDTDAAGNTVLTRLWHDPVDQDPEFLEATRADADGHEQHCFTWNPSQQKSLTSFQGVYATDANALQVYVTTGKPQGLGTCTMILKR